MIKTVLKIDGMACTMCESHVNDGIRNAFPVKKVSSSWKKGTSEILSQEPLDREALKAAVESTGYRVLSVEEGPAEKKGLFHR